MESGQSEVRPILGTTILKRNATHARYLAGNCLVHVIDKLLNSKTNPSMQSIAFSLPLFSSSYIPNRCTPISDSKNSFFAFPLCELRSSKASSFRFHHVVLLLPLLFFYLSFYWFGCNGEGPWRKV